MPVPPGASNSSTTAASPLPRNLAAKSFPTPSTTSIVSPFLPRKTLWTWLVSPGGNFRNPPGSREESTKIRVMGVRVTNPPTGRLP
jgi:hypothetical protein